MFKHSVSRLESLRELASMVRACKTKSPGMRISAPEVDYACGLRKQGLSFGAITHSVFRKFGTSWDISTIEHAIKKTHTNKIKSIIKKAEGEIPLHGLSNRIVVFGDMVGIQVRIFPVP